MTRTFLDKPQYVWDNILWTDESKVELFGNAVHLFFYIYIEREREREQLPTVKHGGDLSCCEAALELAALKVSKE